MVSRRRSAACFQGRNEFQELVGFRGVSFAFGLAVYEDPHPVILALPRRCGSAESPARAGAGAEDWSACRAGGEGSRGR
jgi:hypothetical protein